MAPENKSTTRTNQYIIVLFIDDWPFYLIQRMTGNIILKKKIQK
jgi:hypothetical protein